MLIGAHVSPAGGVAKAVERGVDRGCHAIQIFNQNPRAWKPTVYSDEQVAAFHEAMGASRKVIRMAKARGMKMSCANRRTATTTTIVSRTTEIRLT